MEIGKHAYLIMAHNEPELLMKLLFALDHSRNDIFLHIDKKSTCFDLEALSLLPQKSKITILPPMNVNWGGDSQVRCEMALLKEATRGNYQCYHLLSGVDFPIKSQPYIHAFFDKNPNKSFIHLDSVQQTPEVLDRVRYYWWFQNQIGRNKGKLPALCYYIQQFLIKVQKSCNFDRLRYIYIREQIGSVYRIKWRSILFKMSAQSENLSAVHCVQTKSFFKPLRLIRI